MSEPRPNEEVLAELAKEREIQVDFKELANLLLDFNRRLQALEEKR